MFKVLIGYFQGSESESDVSLAPSSIYRSPPESPDSLSRIDLTLGSEYSKYDLRQQMKNTLEYIFKRGKRIKILCLFIKYPIFKKNKWLKFFVGSTPQPLYNTIVGFQANILYSRKTNG